MEVFAVSQARRVGMYGYYLSFRRMLEELQLLCVATPPCMAYYTELSCVADVGDIRRVRQIIALEAVAMSMIHLCLWLNIV